MGVGITVRFLAGRYHATPWDHQVNEGVVEWPPSPWRLLRALVFAYHQLPDPPERDAMNQLMTQLAEEQPSYVLPSYTTAHTRHYMPIRKEGKNKTTRVFDTFLVFEREARSPLDNPPELKVCWPGVELTDPNRALLQRLCQRVSYLGRAEAWADLEVSDTCSGEDKFTAYPVQADANSMDSNAPDTDGNGDRDRIEVLVPLDNNRLGEFRAALAVLPKPKRGKAKWTAPETILDALELNITDLHKQGWNGIPGSRWVPYAMATSTPVTQYSMPEPPRPNFARYALVSSVLPKLTKAVSVGDRFHRALQSQLNHIEKNSTDPVFSGLDYGRKDAEGKFLRIEGHRHAYYLPDKVTDGRISQVIVYAESGFSKKAVQALARLRKVWSKESRDGTLQTVLLSVGQLDNYRASDSPIIQGKKRVWKSLTPLVLPRHPKVNRRGEPKIDPETQWQIDGPEDQVCRMLNQLGRDRPGKVEVLKGEKISGFYPTQFQTRRYRGGGRFGSSRGYNIRLEFDADQSGPIALGYGSHFGLGLFLPLDDDGADG
ncbi:MAG: type I-U CRISPR-associated protein Csb2 [Cyanobacteria bacterium P01_F01_bin.150]